MFTPRLLMVDDTPGELQALSDGLKHQQFIVDTATGYGPARSLIEKHRYSVVFLDVYPSVDSEVWLLLLDTIKNRDPATEVIVIIGSTLQEDIIKVYRDRVDDVLAKPILPDALVARTREILKRQAITKERDVERSQRKICQVQMEAVFSALDEGLLIVDLNEHVSYGNQTLLTMCNLNESDPLPVSLQDFDKHCNASCIHYFRYAIRTGTHARAFQFHCRCDEHRQRVMLMNSVEIKDSDSTLGHAMIIRDISVVDNLEKTDRHRQNFGCFIGQGQAIQPVYQTLDRLVGQDPDVLIVGESGTGKELIAHQLHEISSRKNQTFIKVDCSRAIEPLFASDLFGRVHGAFAEARYKRKGKFLLADKGTIFLDGVGELPLNIQEKLLRVLQDRLLEPVGGDDTIKVDVRVIASTNQDLRQLIAKKRFHEDLYQRLRVIEIQIPPLRDRVDDLPLLFDHFRKHFNDLRKLNIQSMAPEVKRWFMKYEWPGNVREFRNILEKATMLCRGEILLGHHFPRSVGFPKSLRDNDGDLTGDVTRELMIQMLLEEEFNRSKVAKRMGISRPAFYKMLKRLGIQ